MGNRFIYTKISVIIYIHMYVWESVKKFIRLSTIFLLFNIIWILYKRLLKFLTINKPIRVILFLHHGNSYRQIKK